MIRSFIEDSQSHWDEHLQKFALAIRSDVSETTQVSPALLNLGREIPFLFDREMNSEQPNSAPLIHTTQLQQQLQELVSWVRRNIQKAHETNKKYYDLRHRDVSYQPNQPVLLRTHCLSVKDQGFAAGLAPKWSGPFYVRKSVTPVTYEIVEDLMSKKSKVIHVYDIKPYVERKRFVKKVTPDPIHVPILQKRVLRNLPRVDYRKAHQGN